MKRWLHWGLWYLFKLPAMSHGASRKVWCFSRLISGKGNGQRVVYLLACSARVPKKDVLPLWKEFLWYGFSKRRLLSWKLRSCPKASHTALLLIADFPFSRGCPKGDRKAYIRASFSSQPIPWTFLSESLSLLNWSLDCSSWRKILAYPSKSSSVRVVVGSYLTLGRK